MRVGVLGVDSKQVVPNGGNDGGGGAGFFVRLG